MLGEFELLVLLSILRHPDEPYANRVRSEPIERGGRDVSRGALYRTLDRLREKGLVEWEVQPSAKPERGGHPMRRLLVTAVGLKQVRASHAVIMRFFRGIQPMLND